MIKRLQALVVAVSVVSGAVVADDELDSIGNMMSNSFQSPKSEELKTAGVPLVFSSESMGTSVGGAGVVHGIGPTKASLVLVGIYSSNASGIGMAALYNAGFSKDSRWRFDTEIIGGKFTESRIFNATGSSSHDSGRNDYQEREVTSQDFRMKAKWLLSIGDGTGGYKPQGDPYGLSLDGNRKRPLWNPLTSGRTSLNTGYFYKRRGLDEALDAGVSDDDEYRSSGIRVELDYDNRNGYSSPSAGARTQLTVTRDWGAGSGSTQYTKLELDHAQYFNLGTSDWFRQQVLAVNAYYSDILTWDEDDPNTIPPWFAQSSLGGWNRLRGYSNNRYSGRSAVSYSAELRGITQKNWLGDSFLGDYYNIPWMELAAFVDTGRVANEWDMDTLHSDMKYSYGGSLRFMVEGITMRIDVARADEGGQVWVFINQPF